MTYALAKSATPPSQSTSSKTSVRSLTSRRVTISASDNGNDVTTDFVSRHDMAVKVLEKYTELLCNAGTSVLKKFASYVTNKVRPPSWKPVEETNDYVEWLLSLLDEDDPQIVVLGTKILARVLTVHGTPYVSKFAERNDGFTILTHKLSHWWNEPALWTICFCILFDYDVAKVDFERDFDMFSLLESFQNSKVVNPLILPTIAAMLSAGLQSLLRSQNDPASPIQDRATYTDVLKPPVTPGRSRSMSLNKDLENRSE